MELYSKIKVRTFAYFSSHGTQDLCAIDYTDDMFLIFGKESLDYLQNSERKF